MQLSGIARTEIDIEDLSVLINTGVKGISGVIGVTERGTVNSPTLLGTWLDYVREFGGLMDGVSDFPLLCRRSLEAGAKLMVCRVGHYTDITDKTKLEGAKSSGALGGKFEAANIGAWGNGVKVTVAPSLSGVATDVDITVELAGYSSLTQVIENFPRVYTSTIRDAKFDLFSKYVKLVDVKPLTDGSVTLTGGVQDVSKIVTNDYIGNVVSGTGINAFDNTSEIYKICVPEKAIPAIDKALANYVDKRGDIINIIHTPVGVDGETAINYREGTGVYAGNGAIDSWRTFCFTGDLKILHPDTGVEKTITGVADMLGVMSKRDNTSFEWISFSGPDKGRIKNALGVVYNLGTTARKVLANKVDIRGINMIIEHPTFGVVSFGNSTMQRANTLLKHANIAELMVYLIRNIKPLIDRSLFNPNDIETWKKLHKKVVPLLEYVKQNRGIYDYLYQGDQDIDKIEQAVINTPASIEAGAYTFRLFVKPKPAMKYVGMKGVISGVGVSFDDIQ